MATPVFENGQRIGTLVMAVEMLHLMEFTAHVAPSNPQPQAEIDAREADFSYMVNPEGWAISHPRHFNIFGVDKNGQPVKGISEEDQAQVDNLWRPGNLSQMGFIDPAFPELVIRNQKGQNGMLWTKENQRALIYATIPYHGGQYDTPAGFGLVILSTDGGRLHVDAEVLSKQFDNKLGDLSRFSYQLIITTLIGVLILAVLQDVREGRRRKTKVDVRLISVTNKDLASEVKAGRFRADLYYRLSVVPLKVPPLRERLVDIPLLAEHILGEEASRADRRRDPSRPPLNVSLAGETLALLLAHRWPGNVRELQNVLRFAMIKRKGNVIRPEYLPHSLTAPAGLGLVSKGRKPKITADLAKEALERAGGRPAEAARLLGVSRATFYRHLPKET